MMVADAARIKSKEEEDDKVERRELKTKEDIKNYIKGLR